MLSGVGALLFSLKDLRGLSATESAESPANLLVKFPNGSCLVADDARSTSCGTKRNRIIDKNPNKKLKPDKKLNEKHH